MSDSSSVTIRGVTGQLYWGYHLAGTVRTWIATRGSPTDPGSLTGSIVDVDTFRVSQRPIVFVVQHQHGAWRWPLLSPLQITDDGMLNASLSPKE